MPVGSETQRHLTDAQAAAITLYKNFIRFPV